MFAALAIARDLQNATGYSIKKIIQALRRIHTVIVDVNGHHLTARTPLDDDSSAILDALKARH